MYISIFFSTWNENPKMNRGGEIDFASEDLGLAPVVGDLEGDDFDAFNDDTFGAEDVWVEDDHEEVGIKKIEG